MRNYRSQGFQTFLHKSRHYPPIQGIGTVRWDPLVGFNTDERGILRNKVWRIMLIMRLCTSPLKWGSPWRPTPTFGNSYADTLLINAFSWSHPWNLGAKPWDWFRKTTRKKSCQRKSERNRRRKEDELSIGYIGSKASLEYKLSHS